MLRLYCVSSDLTPVDPLIGHSELFVENPTNSCQAEGNAEGIFDSLLQILCLEGRLILRVCNLQPIEDSRCDFGSIMVATDARYIV